MERYWIVFIFLKETEHDVGRTAYFESFPACQKVVPLLFGFLLSIMAADSLQWLQLLDQYATHHAWKGFRETLRVDEGTERKFVQGVMALTESVSPDDAPVRQSHLRLMLLCSFVDGLHYHISYEGDSTPTDPMRKTVLEKALELLDQILSSSEDTTQADYADLYKAMVLESVLVCLREDNLELGLIVWRRLQKKYISASADVTENIEKVLNMRTKRINARLLDDLTYEDFLKKARTLLEPLFSRYDNAPACPKDALARNIPSPSCTMREDVEPIETEVSPSNLVLSASQMKAFAAKHKICLIPQADLDQIRVIRNDKEAYLAKLPSVIRESLKEYRSSAKKSRPEQQFSEKENFEGDSSVKEETKESLAEYKFHLRKLRMKWSESEEERLYSMVSVRGLGQWGSMVEHFKDRSNIDLKDKWRNLLRLFKRNPKRLKELEEKHGVIKCVREELEK
ncbi:hypothetical protein CAPTEDRAFT_213985 [Capitella teleta]|uniref:Uncharacterized protein n=1 Tax=Capitella teleta TaxID=283909 RepID=R7TNZ0_CAPTE|nr:hypothetical protein CAPTEDRAFT_213985 [Capitella teleta]|eukprot:ELT95272.1 hypothetical protein CAPTEDRAFT_213985 [Capitella teleta]